MSSKNIRDFVKRVTIKFVCTQGKYTGGYPIDFFERKFGRSGDAHGEPVPPVTDPLKRA